MSNLPIVDHCQCTVATKSPYFHRQRKRKRPVVSPYFSCTKQENQESDAPSAMQVAAHGLTSHTMHDGTAITVVARKFCDHCDLFRRRWNNYRCSSNNGTIEEQLRFYYAARHLCTKQCYFCAYTIPREWYAVCKKVHRSPMAKVLVEEEWKCIFNDMNPQDIVFVSSIGKKFHSKVSLLQYLGKRLEEQSVPRKSLFHPSMITTTKILPPSGDRIISAFSPPNSPYGLLEELFVNDPWKLLMSAIFLNRTSRRIVDPILYEFFQSYPTAESVVSESCVHRIGFLIQPLGFHKRRSLGIVAFSAAFLELRKRKSFSNWTPDDVKGMYHCGQYASDVFRLFYLREWDKMARASDHALNMYLAYQRERHNYCGSRKTENTQFLF